MATAGEIAGLNEAIRAAIGTRIAPAPSFRHHGSFGIKDLERITTEVPVVYSGIVEGRNFRKTGAGLRGELGVTAVAIDRESAGGVTNDRSHNAWLLAELVMKAVIGNSFGSNCVDAAKDLRVRSLYGKGEWDKLGVAAVAITWIHETGLDDAVDPGTLNNLERVATDYDFPPTDGNFELSEINELPGPWP